MFSVILCALLGVAAGYMLRRIRALQKVHSTITLTICFMLFVLGLSVGTNSNLMSHFWSYGWQAAVIALSAMLGSLFAAWGLHHFIFKETKEGGEP